MDAPSASATGPRPYSPFHTRRLRNPTRQEEEKRACLENDALTKKMSTEDLMAFPPEVVLMRIFLTLGKYKKAVEYLGEPPVLVRPAPQGRRVSPERITGEPVLREAQRTVFREKGPIEMELTIRKMREDQSPKGKQEKQELVSWSYLTHFYRAQVALANGLTFDAVEHLEFLGNQGADKLRSIHPYLCRDVFQELKSEYEKLGDKPLADAAQSEGSRCFSGRAAQQALSRLHPLVFVPPHQTAVPAPLPNGIPIVTF